MVERGEAAAAIAEGQSVARFRHEHGGSPSLDGATPLPVTAPLLARQASKGVTTFQRARATMQAAGAFSATDEPPLLVCHPVGVDPSAPHAITTRSATEQLAAFLR